MSYFTTKHDASRVRTKSYMIGFILSIILTGIPFWMVINVVGYKAIVLAVVLVCAVVQVLVHLIYFLHLDSKSEGGWNLIAIMFAAIIVLIVVVGSLWIMRNLHYNMMSH